MTNSIGKMCEWTKKTLRNVNGQGLIEYALILVLIAVIVIVAVTNVGKSTSSSFGTVNSSLQP